MVMMMDDDNDENYEISYLPVVISLGPAYCPEVSIGRDRRCTPNLIVSHLGPKNAHHVVTVAKPCPSTVAKILNSFPSDELFLGSRPGPAEILPADRTLRAREPELSAAGLSVCLFLLAALAGCPCSDLEGCHDRCSVPHDLLHWPERCKKSHTIRNTTRKRADV